MKRGNRVVITGMGSMSPLGKNLEDNWRNLLKGQVNCGPITRFDASGSKTQIAFEVPNYTPTDHLEKKEANKLDLCSQFALIAAGEALGQSGVLTGTPDLARVGVIWATGNGGATTYDNALKEYYSKENTRFSPYFVPKVLLDTSSGMISIKYGLRGVNYTTVSACASGSTALVDAFNYIRWNKADVILTGGSDAPISESLVGGFNALKALSTENDQPLRASRPFDETRGGFVMGEGGAALVLENYDYAVARGAHILGELVGGGINADAYHMTAGHPEGKGAADCIQLALDEAGIGFDELDYINAHATSTPVGDLAESMAIARMCQKEYSPMVGATKSMTGHLMGAAGAIEGVFCAMALLKGQIPPMVNLTQKDAQIDPKIKYAPPVWTQVDAQYALSNNFGFGGHNSCVIFKKFTQ